MSVSTATNSLRETLADHYASLVTGGTTQMVFGDGGYSNGEVIDPSPEQTALNNPLLTKAIESHSKPDAYSVEATGRVLPSELVGESISEAGLIVDGELVAIRNFAPKVKENDEGYDFSVTMLF